MKPKNPYDAFMFLSPGNFRGHMVSFRIVPVQADSYSLKRGDILFNMRNYQHMKLKQHQHSDGRVTLECMDFPREIKLIKGDYIFLVGRAG